ncbi:MAG: hypothetical protein ACLP0B_17085 [Steroidobacteraceae bacterium]
MTPEQKLKAAATRARNAAAIKKRVLEAHAVKEATKQAIGAKLAKVEAIASDTRGEANTRAVAATMAPKLREQIAKVRSPFDPPPLPRVLP